MDNESWRDITKRYLTEPHEVTLTLSMRDMQILIYLLKYSAPVYNANGPTYPHEKDMRDRLTKLLSDEADKYTKQLNKELNIAIRGDKD